jgi:hypothetical protein
MVNVQSSDEQHPFSGAGPIVRRVCSVSSEKGIPSEVTDDQDDQEQEEERYASISNKDSSEFSDLPEDYFDDSEPPLRWDGRNCEDSDDSKASRLLPATAFFQTISGE